MSYKHKSGAQKRKEKEEKDLKETESHKGQLLLGHFFKPPVQPSKALVEVGSNDTVDLPTITVKNETEKKKSVADNVNIGIIEPESLRLLCPNPPTASPKCKQIF